MSLATIRLALACSCAVVLAAGTDASSGSARSGELHVTKDCTSYTGKAGDSCTIRSSNLDAIEGATITYAQALEGTALDSDVVLNPPGRGNNLVFGHCQVDLVELANGLAGLCTFSGGTGRFSKFHARVTVSQPDPNVFVFRWDGTYYLSPRE